MRTTASKGPVEGTVQLQEYKGKPTQVIQQLPESLQPARMSRYDNSKFLTRSPRKETTRRTDVEEQRSEFC